MSINRIEISKSALIHNYKMYESIVGAGNVAPVLKSDAYGHGLELCYLTLRECSPQWICVAYIEEVQLLRDLGYKNQILLVAPFDEKDMSELALLDCDILLTHMDLLKKWSREKTKPNAHIKVDTGLSRQGFKINELKENLSLFDHKEIVGLCTHFANVEDVLSQEFSLEQLEIFSKAEALFKDKKLIKHTAASGAALVLPQSRYDFSRVGISIYGIWSSHETKLSFASHGEIPIELKPALTLKSHVDLVKGVKKGSYIGYGCTFRANKDLNIALIPMGYYEGYPRIVGAKQSYVLIHGQRCPLLGRISMNMMVVDVSTLTGVKPKDLVTLIGKDQEEQISADEVSDWADTISYELLSRLHPDIPRFLVD